MVDLALQEESATVRCGVTATLVRDGSQARSIWVLAFDGATVRYLRKVEASTMSRRIRKNETKSWTRVSVLGSRSHPVDNVEPQQLRLNRLLAPVGSPTIGT
jgi:hypothetical protein